MEAIKQSEALKCDAYSAGKDSRTDMIGIYYFLATLYRSQGALDDAKALYQKILRLNPGDRAAQKAMVEIEASSSLANQTSPSLVAE